MGEECIESTYCGKIEEEMIDLSYVERLNLFDKFIKIISIDELGIIYIYISFLAQYQ